MSLHYLVKNEIAICGTQSVVIAMSVTLIKFLRHTVKQAKSLYIPVCCSFSQIMKNSICEEQHSKTRQVREVTASEVTTYGAIEMRTLLLYYYRSRKTGWLGSCHQTCMRTGRHSRDPGQCFARTQNSAYNHRSINFTTAATADLGTPRL